MAGIKLFLPINVLAASFKDDHELPYLCVFFLCFFPHPAKKIFLIFSFHAPLSFLILSVKISTLSFVLSLYFVYISLLLDLHYKYLCAFLPFPPDGNLYKDGEHTLFMLIAQYLTWHLYLNTWHLYLGSWYVLQKEFHYIVDKKQFSKGWIHTIVNKFSIHDCIRGKGINKVLMETMREI